jgi:hypothetical protein
MVLEGNKDVKGWAGALGLLVSILQAGALCILKSQIAGSIEPSGVRFHP